MPSEERMVGIQFCNRVKPQPMTLCVQISMATWNFSRPVILCLFFGVSAAEGGSIG